ncbi:L,D-transpeptidase family protein [Schaalia odontolytica]|uniref:L,D-transpeptidase family protein n=1 Tax=Schaalia odontolytica TaxID=1660 RepID=UPI00211BCD46|nr:L,D-transpeptidase family protein [Schaalia odontolytica]UUO93019.1 L,D-transpeptidase family protein [Schaalia odontolytica]
MRSIGIRLLRCIGASATAIMCVGLFPLAAAASDAEGAPPVGTPSPSAASSPAADPATPSSGDRDSSSAAAQESGRPSDHQDPSPVEASTDSGAAPSAEESALAGKEGEPANPGDPSGRWVRHEVGWRYELIDGTWLKDGVFDVEGGRYAFDALGYVPLGWYRDPSGVWYASTENGVRTGWYREGGSWYHLGDGGAMTTGWLSSGGSWYYLAAAGQMVTGWSRIDGSWYYFDASGAMAASTWVRSGSWYYLGGSGAMATGWFVAGGTWYYADSSGAMMTGWLLTDGSWYHLDSSGALTTGWLRDGGGSWYYLDAARGGAMATGWAQVGGTWNYFDRWKGFWVSDRAGFEADWNYAKTLYSPTNYLVVVDTSAPHCMTFYWADGSWQPLTDMPCSVGKSSTPTITGTFTIKNRGRAFGHGYTAYWWTQFSGDYLFHSILYYEGTYTVMDGTLGGHVSHGCVRLRYEDAKWLHDTIPSGTYVTIY